MRADGVGGIFPYYITFAVWLTQEVTAQEISSYASQRDSLLAKDESRTLISMMIRRSVM